MLITLIGTVRLDICKIFLSQHNQKESSVDTINSKVVMRNEYQRVRVQQEVHWTSSSVTKEFIEQRQQDAVEQPQLILEPQRR